jgi:hypothetical protein
VEQKLLTLLEHMSSLPVFSVTPVGQSLVFCVVFCLSLFVIVCVFVLFPLTNVLSVLLFTDSDYPLGTSKLFLTLVVIPNV